MIFQQVVIIDNPRKYNNTEKTQNIARVTNKEHRDLKRANVVGKMVLTMVLAQ